MGSEIFSILIHRNVGHDGQGNYTKHEDFDQCVYYINHTEDTGKIFFESIKDYTNKANELAQQHPKVIEFLKNPDINKLKGNWLWNVLGQEEYINISSKAARMVTLKSDQLEYEACLNKNEF